MKCARLHLQERAKVKIKSEAPMSYEKPRRYCQKRMVDPEHEEDPRWMDIWDRFHCNADYEESREALDSDRTQQETEDLVLTVQTLKFQGHVDQMKRPRTSFKYKTMTDGNKHRMFVKEVVRENDYSDEDRESQLTCYYFDDYLKYLCNDRSRPASSKSSLFLKGISSNHKENKATQVDINQSIECKPIHKIEPTTKTLPKIPPKQDFKEEKVTEELKTVPDVIEDTKIAYQKTGKRKSLTISRTQSPETVQVIRVDVVCNYATSSKLSNYDESKKAESSSEISIPKLDNISMRNNHFASKYLLTNSIKTLDESLSGGSKVTLLCKTFKLSDRSPKLSDRSNAHKYRKYNKSVQNVSKSDNKVKNRK